MTICACKSLVFKKSSCGEYYERRDFLLSYRKVHWTFLPIAALTAPLLEFVSSPVKKKNSKHECRVFHSDLFGLRKEKYNFLNNVSFESINWRSVPLSSPFFNFNYVKRNTEEEYNKGFSVRDLFQLGTLGVLTKRDSLVIGFSKDELIHKIHDFAYSSMQSNHWHHAWHSVLFI